MLRSLLIISACSTLTLGLVGCQSDSAPVEPNGDPVAVSPGNTASGGSATPGFGDNAPNGTNNNSMENNAVDRTNPNRPNASGNGSGPVNSPGTVAPNQAGAGTTPGAHTATGR